MKKILFILTLVFVSTYTFGQTTIEDRKFQSKHGLGYTAGFTLGWGLSYKYELNKWAFQTSFGPMIEDDYTNISTAIAFMYYLNKTKYTSFYLYQSNNLIYSYDKVGGFDVVTLTSSPIESYKLNNGFGIGIELIAWDRFSFNIMSGYACFNTLGKYGSTRVSPTVETSLLYRF